ncbi:MAG: phosphoribosyltransferase [Deltaproteobacteria bacterium]|nr:phosphoribosyltransferase [Deltaproteobacteria bacterium]
MEYRDAPEVLVLGLARGGVPVAFEVARKLNAPLDVFLVRKLGMPGHEELAMGALASGGALILNEEVAAHTSEYQLARVIEREREELHEREVKYRSGREFPRITDRTVILVDDGLATGASMRVAVKALRQHAPASIVVAVPVAPKETCSLLAQVADRVICALTPRPFLGVGAWYEDFSQTSDDEVVELLRDAEKAQSARHSSRGDAANTAE